MRSTMSDECKHGVDIHRVCLGCDFASERGFDTEASIDARLALADAAVKAARKVGKTCDIFRYPITCITANDNRPCDHCQLVRALAAYDARKATP